MPRFPAPMLQRTAIAMLFGIAIALVLQTASPAQSVSRLESRITQLEFEIRNLRNQLSQASSGGLRVPDVSRPASGPSSSLNALDPSLEAQFDNLATLAIELKQDLGALEQRVATLEAAVSPSTSTP